MKINKHNPRHLMIAVYLYFIFWVAIFISLFTKRHNGSVVYFGHRLNGNIKPMFERMLSEGKKDVYYLTINNKYYHQLIEENLHYKKRILSSYNLMHMIKVLCSGAIITTHGLQLYTAIGKLTNIALIDVWHGIPYKGWSSDNFVSMHKYNEVLVTSDKLKKLYVSKYGFKDRQVQTTGYARTDRLVNTPKSDVKLRTKYNLPRSKKIILFAPTWNQDIKDRSILPFGLEVSSFFEKLDSLAKELDYIFIVRTHLNSTVTFGDQPLSNIIFMPYMDYDNTEDFLIMADVLVTDWSSIAFDYLVLDRPTIFLDVPAPFSNDFSLGPEYRFGDVVTDFPAFQVAIRTYITNPQIYLDTFSNKHEQVKNAVYGNTLDGHSTHRCLDRVALYA